MNIGVTLLFKEKESEEIKGVLKSLVIDTTKKDFFKSILNIAKDIETNYIYKYLGINDIFIVSDEIKESSLLGRTTLYDLNDLSKAKNLVSNEFSYNENSNLETFNCSLIYFCENESKEKYTISVLSIIDSAVSNVLDKVKSLSQNNTFIKTIKDSSVELIKNIQFVGIEDICDIDLKFNIFQSFYADFENMKSLKEEVLLNEEIENILKDVFTTENSLT